MGGVAISAGPGLALRSLPSGSPSGVWEAASIGRQGIRHINTARRNFLPATPPAAGVMVPEHLSEPVLAALDATRAAIREFSLNDARLYVERALGGAPDSFTVHAIHGEVLYRLGLYREASSALFSALVLPPSDWANYQVVNHLYQESRARERGSFVRNTDCPPPKPIDNAIRWVAARFSWMARFRRLDTPTVHAKEHVA